MSNIIDQYNFLNVKTFWRDLPLMSPARTACDK